MPLTEEKTIVKMKFGSHLYGTATPDSDTDYKGIFLPTVRDVLLNRVPKSHNHTTKCDNAEKNCCDDVDTEMYSLHYFIQLALEGQTVALDMLHATQKHLVETSPLWNQIVTLRQNFYTKNLKAFIGYARRQASKYGIKGSRLNAADQIIALLKKANSSSTLYELWDLLPVEDHLYFVDNNPNGIPQYQVCGKTMQATQKVGYTLAILEKFKTDYGARARQAANNEGIDWKAISHAVRAAMQVKELLIDNTITFPLKEAALLRNIKQGQMDYTSQVVPLLEGLMDEVEALSEKSNLPEKPDRKFWENWLIGTIYAYIL